MADEAITYLLPTWSKKRLLPTRVVILIPISVNHIREERGCPPGQDKNSHCFHWRGSQRAEPSQGMIQRLGPRWLEVLITHLQEMESWGWCGKEKNPPVLIDPLLRLPKKFRPKHRPSVPPPTLQWLQRKVVGTKALHPKNKKDFLWG